MTNNKYSKLVLGLAAGILAAATSRGEIVINDKLKVDGFIDMSTTYKDTDEGSESTASFDQWEIDFHFAPVEKLSARVDLNDVNATDEGAEVEQAFLTYDFENGLTASAGKFLSALGYEGAEPTLLYQYSVSATIIGYPGYASGANARYSTDLFSIYGAVVDGFYSGDNDPESFSGEAQFKLFPVEGLTLQAGYATEEFEETLDEEGAVADAAYDKGILNFWAEYKTGGLTLAAEYNELYEIQGKGSDGDGYLVMANYDFGAPAITLRHSNAELDNGYEDTEFTISPSYQVTANLLAIAEYRHDDLGDAGDTDTYALELLYTF